ncbi:MAG TPA: transcriptional regulator NrdR [Pantanalinema sp.]
MRCPMCNSPDSRVLESRLIEEDTTLRRRRDCAGCGKRFTTYERVETAPLMIAKRDGTREPFDPRKLATGLMRACVKSDVSVEAIERIVAEIESDLHKRHTREVPSQEIGEMTLARLRDLDEVAYVRFASVYRNFTGIEDFIHELKTLQATALTR